MKLMSPDASVSLRRRGNPIVVLLTPHPSEVRHLGNKCLQKLALCLDCQVLHMT